MEKLLPYALNPNPALFLLLIKFKMVPTTYDYIYMAGRMLYLIG